MVIVPSRRVSGAQASVTGSSVSRIQEASVAASSMRLGSLRKASEQHRTQRQEHPLRKSSQKQVRQSALSGAGEGLLFPFE